MIIDVYNQNEQMLSLGSKYYLTLDCVCKGYWTGTKYFWFTSVYMYNMIFWPDCSYFEIKIQSKKSVCPAIGLTTALLSTGMFYACGWGDEDGKPTYGYHGEEGCIKKNMFDGTVIN